MRPNQPVEIFSNVSTPLRTLASGDFRAEFYRDRPRETHLSGAKRKRGSQILDLSKAISETVQDMSSGTIHD